MPDYLFFIIFALIAACFFIGRAYFDHRRTQAVKALAPQVGFEFLDKEVLPSFRDQTSEYSMLPVESGGFSLFSNGRSRKASNILKGRIGSATIYLFDYCYRTGSGKNSHTHRFTVALIQSENFHLPEFRLQPEHFLHKVGNVLGFRDIDFDHEPEFSKTYLLNGADEEHIRQIFNYRVISFYNNQQRVCTEGLGDTLLYYVRQQYPVKEWPNFLTQAKEAANAFSTSSHYV